MQHIAGVIPPLTKDKIPHRMVIFDTEANRGGFINGVEAQSLKLGVARYIELAANLEIADNEYYNFTDVTDLYRFIEFNSRKDKTLFIYAHNLKYDLQLSGLLTLMLSEGWRVGLFVISDPPTFIRLKRGRVAVTLVDTFNYWQFSLSRMGQQLGLEKLTIPHEGDSLNDWFVYCRRDVDVLSEYLLSHLKWLYVNDLAPLGLTVASQAFRTYRHSFMTHPITLHNDKKVTELERMGYYGGRVEAYHIGSCPTQPYYKLDVNSMYPYVMLNNLYPYKLVGYSENIPIDKVKELLSRYYLIAECELNTPYPVYPYRQGGKLKFPTGRFTTTIHSPEVAIALANDELQVAKRIACYERGDIFSAYVKYFYSMKVEAEQAGNQVLRQQSKLYLNSLYGKFGQREVITKIVDNTHEPSYTRINGYSESLGKRVCVNYLGKSIQISYPGGESAYSFPAIAGAVTSYARVYLWYLMEACGYGHYYYVDTDSLIIDRVGYDRMGDYLSNDRLGYLKVEGLSDSLTIRGLKDYSFGDEVKHKGIPHSAIEISPNVWMYEQFRGAKTWLTLGLPTGNVVNQVLKHRVGVYDKGVILPDGSISPLRLNGG